MKSLLISPLLLSGMRYVHYLFSAQTLDNMSSAATCDFQ